MNDPRNTDSGIPEEDLRIEENDAVLKRKHAPAQQTKKHPSARRHYGYEKEHESFGQKVSRFMDGVTAAIADGLYALWKGIVFVAETIFKPFVLTCWLGVLLSVVVTALCENGTITSRLGASTAYAVITLLVTGAYAVWLSHLIITAWGNPFGYYAKSFLPFWVVYGIAPVLACFLPGRGEPVFTYLFLPFKASHFIYQEMYARHWIGIALPPLTSRLISSGISALFLILISTLSAWIFHAVREKRIRG